MDNFRLEKPKIEKSDRDAVLNTFGDDELSRDVGRFVREVNDPDYKYWDLVKHKKPLPAGLTAVQAWFAVKINRFAERNETPIKTEDGHVFSWKKLLSFERYCHEFDLHTGGDLLTSVGDLKNDEKKRLISKGLMDEAIASAQLEGADTTRVYAQKMLREKIQPRNESDQMISNNHKAMLEVEGVFKNKHMSVDLLREMHSILVENTKDSDGELPRMRVPGEPMFVVDRAEGVIYHRAPDMVFVSKALEELVQFANDDGSDFIHPIIKAAMLHFWIGYLHPFTDGNGRLARLIFYWYLLRNNYWAFGYLPVAASIKEGGKKSYTMAYVYSEQDGYDLTYFISFLLKRSFEAYKTFQKYVDAMRAASRDIAASGRKKFGLNDRQIQLIKYLDTDPENTTTITSYISVNRVSRITAIKDLDSLVRVGLLRKQKIGRTIYFYGEQKIKELIS